MAKTQKNQDVAAVVAKAMGCNPEDVAAVNQDGTVAVVITQLDAFKVSISGEKVTRVGDETPSDKAAE